MKRIVAFLMVLTILLCIAACGERADQSTDVTNESTESGVATEPSDPSDPSDPTEASDPTEPSVPTVPTEPTNPIEPSEPAEPSDPVEPSDPSDSTTENVPDDDPVDSVPGTDDNTENTEVQDFSIVGTWITNSEDKEYYVFSEDGTAKHCIHPGDYYKEYSYTYEFKGNVLFLYMDYNGLAITYRYDVTIFTHRGLQDICLYGGAYCYNGEYIDKETADDVYEHIYLTNAANAKEQWDNLSLFGNWVSDDNSIVFDADGRFIIEYDDLAFEGQYYLEINWRGKDLLDSSAYLLLFPDSDYQTDLGIWRLKFLINYDENRYFLECEDASWEESYIDGQFVKQVLD